VSCAPMAGDMIDLAEEEEEVIPSTAQKPAPIKYPEKEVMPKKLDETDQFRNTSLVGETEESVLIGIIGDVPLLYIKSLLRDTGNNVETAVAIHFSNGGQVPACFLDFEEPTSKKRKVAEAAAWQQAWRPGGSKPP